MNNVFDLGLKVLGLYTSGLIFVFFVALLMLAIVICLSCASELYVYEKRKISQIRMIREKFIKLELSGSGGTLLIEASSIRKIRIKGKIAEVAFKNGIEEKYRLKKPLDIGQMYIAD